MSKEDGLLSVSRNLRPFMVTNEDGTQHGYLVDDELSSVHCDGCGARCGNRNPYTVTWTQGERGEKSNEPDVMVVIECLPCFTFSDWTHSIKWSETISEFKKVPAADVKVGVWGEW